MCHGVTPVSASGEETAVSISQLQEKKKCVSPTVDLMSRKRVFNIAQTLESFGS